MKMLRAIAVALWPAIGLAAEIFDGTTPMSCLPLQGHDCLPARQACQPLMPESGKDLTLHVDVAAMSIRTPYRYDTLPIQSIGTSNRSLVMQGTSLEYAWSATIHRTTGRLTIAIADREGAYIVFGQCKLAEAG